MYMIQNRTIIANKRKRKRKPNRKRERGREDRDEEMKKMVFSIETPERSGDAQ